MFGYGYVLDRNYIENMVIIMFNLIYNVIGY